ncbi:transcription factor kayak [Nilaparvata lugens]|uniref:transcription factor kayak n=1 Tax=Nilaparvata lugens TaxID=108931 RepID=UPI00193CE7B4|nr:transcription factor kayak [Nilaparvata lugens]
MFSNSTNAKKRQMEKLSICPTDFLTNTSGDLQISTPNSLCLDGLNCGIPTRTTPTITPTTLRNIEQTFLELQGGALLQGVGEGDPHQAGFMPPVIQPPLSTQGSSVFMNLVDTKSWQGGTTTLVTDAPAPANTQMLRNITSSSVNTPTTTPPPSTRKNVGGRRPNRDNSETEDLESKKMNLQSEIHQLQQEKEELELLLKTHEPVCRLLNAGSPVDVKPKLDMVAATAVRHEMSAAAAIRHEMSAAVTAARQSMPAGRHELPAVLRQQEMPAGRHQMPAPQQPGPPRPRPTSLPVVPNFGRPKEAVPISTPTSGVNFNFDSLMEGGTGLTPVSAPLAPSCSSQQRSQAADLQSPVSVSAELVSL